MPDDRKERSRVRALVNFLRRLFGKPPQFPGDPYADHTAPLRPRPKGRSGEAAVLEPEEDSYRAFPPRT